MSESRALDREALTNQVYQETGVNIAKDDPILTLIVTHDLILDSYERRWQRCTENAVNKIERKANHMLRATLATTCVAAALCLFTVWVFT